MDLSIIIVSWNVSGMLADCIKSIEYSLARSSKSISAEIIVVDSASTDNTVELIRSQFPDVKMIAEKDNVGFTRGNNIGFSTAKGRHLLLLNPDTFILDNAIEEMIDYLDNNPDVGIVGPHTLNTDGTHQSTRRRFPTPQLAFFESTWLQPYAPGRLMENYYVADAPDNATVDVDWVQGSALMARHEVYKQLGGLDEGYVMYCEEMDWCRRARSAGWRVVYLGTSQIIHHGGKSSEQSGARKHILFQQSKIRYFRLYHGKAFASILRIFLLANYGWQIVIEGLKALLGLKRPLRRERIRIYWQVLRSGLGNQH